MGFAVEGGADYDAVSLEAHLYFFILSIYLSIYMCVCVCIQDLAIKQDVRSKHCASLCGVEICNGIPRYPRCSVREILSARSPSPWKSAPVRGLSQHCYP
ncbi:hypothetical protein ABL78_8467 [Leptomonas seymouri]|uniref:Uncharacterized protein n=1 Tax=Leptomonas seymouri TaxID=5684 RepID=A0A0N1PAM9_LEPSE|nr:hypothetical protein ABL78_8467 [Leptomonas seymouri]|eukprot:KPI82522.1 hypothetical protein ABL78_8467 [Leptomonas seymouri]